MKKYLIIDTSSMLRILGRNTLEKLLDRGFIVISELVLKELKDKHSRFLIESSLDKITVLNPKNKTIDEVKNRLRGYINELELSDTDFSIIALAYELLSKNRDVIVITEDYDIQNACALLGIEFESIERKKISRVLRTLKKCLVCDHYYDSHLEECPYCGSKKFKLIKVKIRNTD